MDMPFMQAERYLSKLTASHFSTLNMDFANWNMLKMILIAMLNENKADWNENFSDMIYIKTQVFRLLRYYSPTPRNIARSDWATQNITHNMTSSIIQPYGLHSL